MVVHESDQGQVRETTRCVIGIEVALPLETGMACLKTGELPVMSKTKMYSVE